MADQTTNVTSIYPTRMLDDLAKSGLVPTDIRAKPLTNAEKAATYSPMGADGYVIPYFDMRGKPLPFYRVKLYEGDVKYRQMQDSPNHIYFPPRLQALLGGDTPPKYIIITEGEKKAACAVKNGFPCVGLGGVDSWRTNTLILPKDTALAQKADKTIAIKLPAGANIADGADKLATGLKDLTDYVTLHNIPLIIIYDTDSYEGLKPEVARAAATFAFELRHKGVALRNIRQLILPSNGGKVGLDDYLEEPDNIVELSRLLKETIDARTAFPRHPNVRDYVNRRLQRTHLSRQEQMGISLAVLCDLDARGQRLRSPDEDQLYYFDGESKTLTKAAFNGKGDFAETPFGIHLYQEYNLSLNDNRILNWLITQFAGEAPINKVYPEKVLCWRGDVFYYQVGDGVTARVDKDGITIIDNGDDGVLFEAGMVEGISGRELRDAIKTVREKPWENWWYDVLKDARIRDSSDDKQRLLLSLLYYVSPLFYRWRGTQLPVEITIGEAGSGKSTLYELRLSILTGVPKLRNAPSDLKDWNASLANTGSLHVTDNVQLTDNSLRQRLSDEICRLVTEPNPTIEQRKLYTDTGTIKIPVRCVFAITAIRQPFTNIDIIQRAIITELDKGVAQNLKYDAAWKSRQLEGRGGRAVWLAHQLMFVHKMLKEIDKTWDPNYQAKYRLIHVEQLLQKAAQVFGLDASWVAGFLESSRDKKMSENDWTLEGLALFADKVKDRYAGADVWTKLKFTAENISTWAKDQEEFAQCHILINSRSLARYLSQHKHTVATTVGIVPVSDSAGKMSYSLREPIASD